MRWMTRFLTLSFSLPLLCMFGFAALMVATIGVAAQQLPGWAQKPVIGWMLGVEQMTGRDGSESGPTSSPAGVGVGWDGYTGPGAGAPAGIPLSGSVYITCDFHDPMYTRHTGVDLVLWPEATLGAPVSTPLAGKVVWAGWNGPWGNLVVVENDGYQAWFAHLSAIQVSSGERVDNGDVVGRAGSTGNSTGPHVHYGLKRQTEGGQVWLDPLGYFDTETVGWAVCD